jgi:threonine dehydratase
VSIFSHDQVEFLALIDSHPCNTSFIKLHSIIHPRATTEFSYRYSSDHEAHIITSFLLNSSPSSASISPEARAKEVGEIVTALEKEGMTAVDLSDDEFAKSHVRHMVGGRRQVPYERVFRFGKSHMPEVNFWELDD